MTMPTPESSNRVSSIPAAAVGITYGTQGRPPDSFTARAATTKTKPIKTSVRVRAQYSGRKRHSQPSMSAATTVPSNIQAAILPQSTRAWSRPK